MSNLNLAQLAFTGIETAKKRIDANYIKPGHVLARIDQIKLDKTRKDEIFFAVVMTVVHVYDDAKEQQRPPGSPGPRVGEEITHMMMKKHDSFLGNVKAFISNTLAMDDSEITMDHAIQLCHDDQPLSGTVVEVQSRLIETKKGGDFTQVSYRREVPPAELLTVLGEDVQSRFFPGNLLQGLVEAEAAQAAQG